MINIDFNTLNSTEVFLSNIDKRLQNFSRLWMDYVAPFVYDEVDDVFDRAPWKPLNPIYAARKARTHPGKGILRREDNYFRAATTPHHPGSLLEVSKTELVIGVRGDYFEATFGINYPRLHEEGAGNLPARPVYLNVLRAQRFRERVGQLAEKWQEEEINGVSGRR